jgi:hypothetical protein
MVVVVVVAVVEMVLLAQVKLAVQVAEQAHIFHQTVVEQLINPHHHL